MNPPAWKVVTPARPDNAAKFMKGGKLDGPAWKQAKVDPSAQNSPKVKVVSPTTAFNRRSIGGASGVNSALRARAYTAIDSGRAGSVFRNTPTKNDVRPVILPKADLKGNTASYTELRLRDGPHGGHFSNGRVVVDRSQGGPGGQAYISRHYGQQGKLDRGDAKVLRIQ